VDELLAGFVNELRNVGFPVSLTENIDAAAAVQLVPIENREAVKAALAATLVKEFDHYAAFETVFDIYFSTRRLKAPDEGIDVEGGADSDVGGAEDGVLPGGGGGLFDSLTREELIELIYRAMRESDRVSLRALSVQAVRRYAGFQPGRPVAGTYYLFRTLKELGAETMYDRLMDDARALGGGQLSIVEERLAAEESQERVDLLRREVESEIRRRLVDDRGPDAVAQTLRKPLPEDVDFIKASAEQIIAMERVMQPLTRKLAASLARKRRHKRHGALDFRKTVRVSLSYGGVPAELRFRRPSPSKPNIFVIADISGSVAAFAQFTLQLVYAIKTEFTRVRSFVFVDGIDEVTELFDRAENVGDAAAQINDANHAIWVDGRSDYGHALEVFWEQWGQQIRSTTSIIILGDARTNYHASQAWALKAMRDRARHVYWLNPEPRAMWNTGDSIVDEYVKHTDGYFEVRNLRQLREFVTKLD
jgi:uncharacterized protein with von Willebrand factor type A (vWA) domain